MIHLVSTKPGHGHNITTLLLAMGKRCKYRIWGAHTFLFTNKQHTHEKQHTYWCPTFKAKLHHTYSCNVLQRLRALILMPWFFLFLWNQCYKLKFWGVSPWWVHEVQLYWVIQETICSEEVQRSILSDMSYDIIDSELSRSSARSRSISKVNWCGKITCKGTWMSSKIGRICNWIYHFW